MCGWCMSNTIVCSLCKKTKPASSFVKCNKNKTGYRKYCKSCHNIKAKEYREKNPDKVKDQKLRQTLGVTLSQKRMLVAKQKNKCPICKINLDKAKYAPVDHCHTTGKIRAVLCHNCNIGIGHLKDSLVNLFMAAVYLIKHRLF